MTFNPMDLMIPPELTEEERRLNKLETFLSDNKNDIKCAFFELWERERKNLINFTCDYVPQEWNIEDLDAKQIKDLAYIDVRLCVDIDSDYVQNGFIFRTGLNDFDPYHSQFCSASIISIDGDKEAILNDLLSELY